MDKVKRFISDFKRCPEDNTIARDVIFEMTKKYIDHDLSVIIDQAFKIDEIKKYENLANKHKIAFYKFQLFTSPEIAHIRILNRQKDFKDRVPKNEYKKIFFYLRKKLSMICNYRYF